MKNGIGRFLREESGATVVEYAILVSLIAAVVVFIVAAVGGGVENMFEVANTAWSS